MTSNSKAAQILDAENGATYHSNDDYDREYRLKGTFNKRPFFETSGKAAIKATIKWAEFTTNGSEVAQIAWIVQRDSVMGPELFRFLSFSDVNEPHLAKNWKYHTDENVLIDAPEFKISLGKFHSISLLLGLGSDS